MLTSAVRASVVHWRIVLILALVYAAIAFQVFRTLPIEAFPDVTDPLVEVVTVFPGPSAEVVERRVTLELERVLASTPHLTNIRSVSIFGLSLVTLRFADGSVDFDNRVHVAERLREAELPEGIEALIGPQATPVGQIYRYTLHGPLSLRELRSLQDWVVERRLRSVPGVADVVTFGGFERQYAVRIDPVRLASMGVSVGEVFTALERTNANAGGGYVGIGSQDFIVRGLGTMRDPAEIGAALVVDRGGVPVRIRDVADVIEGSTPRRGAVGRGGDDEVVEGIVLLRRGENAKLVLEALSERVEELNQQILPKDVKLVPFYDRRDLIGTTVSTVGHNLLHGAILVVLIIVIFLRSPQGAVIVGAVIPIALLTSFVGLKLLGRSANLISLGAVDFGILVENAAVVLEVTLHAIATLQASGKLPLSKEARREVIVAAAGSVTRPVGFATLIIIVGLVPLFMLERVEGRIFAPMAFTYVFALFGARLAATTVVPALMYVMLPERLPHGEARWFEWVKRRYEAILASARRRPLPVLGSGLAAVLALGVYGRSIGTEFLPELNEGGLYITAVFPSTIALDETRRHVPEIRRRIMALPEAVDVLSHIGRPEDATQTEGPNNVEFFVALAPMDAWRPGYARHDLEEELRRSLAAIPGVSYNFSQPITDRVFETVSGIIGQIVVKVRGEDLGALTRLAEEIERRLSSVEGVADLSIYQAGDAPQVSIQLDRDRLAQHGLTVMDAQEVVEVALGGKIATEIWDGERRYGVALRLPESVRQDLDALGRLVVGAPERRVTLAEVAEIAPARGRAAIWREDLARFVAVKFNVRGADMGTVVGAAQAALTELELPEGVRVTWGGEFENQQRAMRRLAVVVPLTLLAMVGILFANFRRWRPTLLIMALLPLALVVAVAFLQLAGQNFSVAAAIGCVTLLGQVTLGGVLVCSRIDERAAEGAADPVGEGASIALRPVLLTMALAALGLVPAALSTGMGAESQRPFAITIVGGLLGAIPLVLLVLPLLYRPAGASGTPGSVRASAGSGLIAVLLAVLLGAPGVSHGASERGEGDEVTLRATARAEAGAPEARSEEEVLRRWLDESPEVAAWKTEIGAARFDVVTAGLLPNPELSIGGSGLLRGDPPDGLLNAGAELSVPLPIFGQRGARIEAAERALSVAEMEVATRLWDRAAEIRAALVSLAFLEGERRLAKERLAEIDALERIVASRAAAGFDPAYELLRIHTVGATLVAEADKLDAEHARAEGVLLGLVAAPGLERVRLGPAELRVVSPPEDPERLADEAITRRPDLRLAKRSERAFLALAHQLRREAIPTPSLVVGSYFTRDPTSSSLVLGVGIPLPLFDRNQGLAGRAEVEASGQRLLGEGLEARARAEIRAAVEARQRALAALERFRTRGVANTLDLLEKARRAYQAGVFGITELLEAHESVWAARREAIDLERTAAEATAELARAAALGE